jgi:hypothetical protein
MKDCKVTSNCVKNGCYINHLHYAAVPITVPWKERTAGRESLGPGFDSYETEVIQIRPLFLKYKGSHLAPEALTVAVSD